MQSKQLTPTATRKTTSGQLAPGATLGMLGGGQLGRMSILAGRRMGYRFVVLDPAPDCCAAAVADRHIIAAYDDADALRELAACCDRVTLEFENIPARTLEILAPLVTVFPGAKALRICQNRRLEKGFLADNGFPCAPFAVVGSVAELESALQRIGYPAVLKTADFGYDGKGQLKIEAGADLAACWAGFAGGSAVLEGWVRFSDEYSVICGRSTDGSCSVYPLIRNTHRNHILHTSVCPSGLSAALEQQAATLAMRIAEALELVGVLAVELFLTAAGWVVNEMAPRPHNSGHLTLEASLTSQFEQHIRRVCGLPGGSTALVRPACMLNLLGDTWADGAPDFAAVLADDHAKLHLYDKGEPRHGRKMGHLTFLGDDVESAVAAAGRADRCLHERR